MLGPTVESCWGSFLAFVHTDFHLYRATKKMDKVRASIWLSRFFIVNFKCSTKEGVGGLETTLSQDVKA